VRKVIWTLAALALAFAYTRLRGPILTWGATGEEAAARLPGDELLEDADGVATRAITIDASASAVLPAFQHPRVGDGFGFGPNKMRYVIIEPERTLALRSADGNWVWTFVLEARDGGTRLISRNRFRLPRLRDRIGMLPMEPGSLVMERKMLRGIKQRAERLAAEESLRSA
jgi:hypothetical protein